MKNILCPSFRLVRHLLLFSLFVQMPLQAGPLPTVELPRMSKVTIAETTAKLESDMSRIRWRSAFLLLATGGGVAALIKNKFFKGMFDGEVVSYEEKDEPTTHDAAIAQHQAIKNLDLAMQKVSIYLAKQASASYWFVYFLAVTFAASSAGFIWASWQDAAENATSSLKRWMTGLTRGYKGWLLHETAVLEKNARVLYHSLTYASNSNAPAEQLVTYKPIMKDDDELAHLGYRGDSARRFEKMFDQVGRILALMFLVTPKNKHAAVQKDVNAITQHLNRLGDLVERDINNATSRFIVEYEKETQQSFVDLFEELHARLASYDIKARA